MYRRVVGALILATCLAAAHAHAQDAGPRNAGVADAGAPGAEEEASEEGGPPMPLYIGVYPLRISDLDLRTGSARVTYYVWTRWAGSADGTAYELVNGSIDAAEHEYRYEEGGERYAYFRHRATVQVDLDFHQFPLDEHELRLEFEHSDEGDSSLVFVIDEPSVRHIASPPLSGWLVDPPRFDVVTSTYRTNWGMPGVDPEETSTFSRARMVIPLHHAAVATFLKTFLTLFIAVLITFLGFFVHPDLLDARVGVGVAGMFGAVTSQAVVSANLPDIPYLTLSDKIHFAGLTFIFLVLLETCVVGVLWRGDRKDAARKLDLAARIVMAPVFALAVLGLILTR